ncbi:RND family efflux transporter, MFP subunit [Palleronia salina]|uniref:RND family efflux transporter, MFP subunit n=1 Tax=Palleronia salina TaxID=313368 RepID=A0A1M6LLC0_9RHOB|nr:efflux RND transporter periplasmic adaptor subunit [Palleronia salina]SHJ72026.1 RND family efflux transporter, MFP subunit [Palleronia salina]
MTGLLRLLCLVAALPAAAQDYDCLMDPAEEIELGSSATGLLLERLVDRGDTVKKGQLVARLKSEIERSTVELLETRAESSAVIDAQRRQLEMIERRYERVATLRERGVATEEQFDAVEAERIASQSLLFQAELNREIAVKELERARISLDQREIRSPVDGIVAEAVLSAGEYVGSDDHLVRIVRLDPLKIEAFLPVSLYGEVSLGDSATVRPVAPLDGAYEAKIVAIDRVFDAASSTFVVVLELPNETGQLPAGHRCRLALGPPDRG